MDKSLNIVWLPGWFPSRVDFLPGDFIERHAKAVSESAFVTVIYVVKDPALKNTKTEIVKETIGNLVIYRGYYNAANKISSVFHFYKLLFTLYKLAEKERGRFDLCHLHVPLKQSLLAIRLKQKYKLNYVITEHNSWYSPGDNSFFFQSFFLKRMITSAYYNAEAVHVVSRDLGEKLQKMIPIVANYTVIPNVVNTDFFTLADKTNKETINFITVTGENKYKNTDGIIRAFAMLIKSGANAYLNIAGPDDAVFKQQVKELGIENRVVFYGIVSNKEIAELTKRSDAMIFFTRSETFGCVMAESLCCGVPVIASRIPVLEESLTENKNALFVEPDNENDLTEKLSWFINHKDNFDNSLIAAEAFDRYNYHRVASQFMAFYNRTLKGLQ
jgi:L-malate glycosyltransferase